ncbi:hypothetical protein HPB50_023953 [Hyalomma asiaticum]|uniref:Uncharacterized protein n=1 Tax=Hyalomma asiaticum TaxID=266040 RepID=A0ACB7S8U9_HYAAI|nr:hypothetical protein HPB50_023953 [Hyalomma asiaticum]
MTIPQPHATEHSDACAVAAGLTGTARAPVRPSASTVVEHIRQTPLIANCGRGNESSLPSRPLPRPSNA